ncbi:hypothetical protein MUK42_15241 [Musa troglodytarum]|uniref:Uncharacterized protein n=1 Tax=Musa troglodytarum TaxID=320322 RepID=A0A9E7LF60_9LILI|nr:hypothetical protein MUK42_15241 [Musa troglodytarum]
MDFLGSLENLIKQFQRPLQKAAIDKEHAARKETCNVAVNSQGMSEASNLERMSNHWDLRHHCAKVK